jgi:hypothetical protein
MQMVKQRVFNNHHYELLISNALISTFSLSIIMKIEVWLLQVDNLVFIQDDLILNCLLSN